MKERAVGDRIGQEELQEMGSDWKSCRRWDQKGRTVGDGIRREELQEMDSDEQFQSEEIRRNLIAEAKRFYSENERTQNPRDRGAKTETETVRQRQRSILI